MLSLGRRHSVTPEMPASTSDRGPAVCRRWPWTGHRLTWGVRGEPPKPPFSRWSVTPSSRRRGVHRPARNDGGGEQRPPTSRVTTGKTGWSPARRDQDRTEARELRAEPERQLHAEQAEQARAPAGRAPRRPFRRARSVTRARRRRPRRRPPTCKPTNPRATNRADNDLRVRPRPPPSSPSVQPPARPWNPPAASASAGDVRYTSVTPSAMNACLRADRG